MTVSGLPFPFYDEDSMRYASKLCGDHVRTLDELYDLIPEPVRERAVKAAKSTIKNVGVDIILEYCANSLGLPMDEELKKKVKKWIDILIDTK